MYNVKLNDTNEVLPYIIYMIMGSYFKKAVCKSTLKEKQLRVVYCETKRDSQVKFEERCINYIDTKIVGVIPDEVFNDMVDVQFVLNNKEHRIDVLFTGFNWKLLMWGVNTTKGVLFDYKFISKDDDEEE